MKKARTIHIGDDSVTKFSSSLNDERVDMFGVTPQYDGEESVFRVGFAAEDTNGSAFFELTLTLDCTWWLSIDDLYAASVQQLIDLFKTKFFYDAKNWFLKKTAELRRDPRKADFTWFEYGTGRKMQNGSFDVLQEYLDNAETAFNNPEDHIDLRTMRESVNISGTSQYDFITEKLLSEGEPAEEGDDKEKDDQQGAEPSEESHETEQSEGNSEVKPFQNLDLLKMICFGFSSPKSKCWLDLAIRSETVGWNNESVETSQLKSDFAVNVNACYFYLATAILKDLDDDTVYLVNFNNDKYMWNVMIKDSPKAEIPLESKAAFFSSEMFKKIAERTAEKLIMAKGKYELVVSKHLENAEMLETDEVKLSRILTLLNEAFVIENVRNGKWMK